MMLASICSGSGGFFSTMIVTSVMCVVSAFVRRPIRPPPCRVRPPERMLLHPARRRPGEQAEALGEVHGGRPVADVETPVDQRGVVLDRVDREPERIRDSLVGGAL